MTLPCLFFSIFIPIFFLQIFTIVCSVVLAKRSDPYFPILSSMEIDAIFQICPFGPSNLRFVVSCISNLVISSLTHQSNCMFLWIMEIGLLQHDAFYKKNLLHILPLHQIVILFSKLKHHSLFIPGILSLG